MSFYYNEAFYNFEQADKHAVLNGENTMKVISVLAFDYGASSGKAAIGLYNGEKVEAREIHRFSNDPVMINGTMYWDILRLFLEMKRGMMIAKRIGDFDNIGVDTWGVDFGLIDEYGRLIGNPVHYRDARTSGMMEKGIGKVGKHRFYEVTGNQFMEINTAFQLLSVIENESESIKRAKSMLLMSDLFNYFLTGKRNSEYSIASTTQLTNVLTRDWSDEVIGKLGIPKQLFPEIVPAGISLGQLTDEIKNELCMQSCSVTAVCGHDTESALIGVPATGEDFISLSCGTWSLMGTELQSPIVSSESEKLNLTNEGCFGTKTAFLKNMCGLWLIQECRRQWIREGKIYDFAELEEMASGEIPFRCFINPDAKQFSYVGNVPERIRKYCKETGQKIPETEGQIVKCIDESLSLQYRHNLENIEMCTGKQYKKIYIVGGGINSSLLCQMTASACKIPVYAGPIEAAIYGNIAVQLISKGELNSVKEFRNILNRSILLKQYEPKDNTSWDEAYERFCALE